MGNPVYFLHIPKTAGTSLRGYLEHVFGPEQVSPPLLWDHVVRETPDRMMSRWPVIVGHFGGLLPLWLGRWPRIITMLRDPRARSLSHINHVKRDEQHPLHPVARDLSIIEYCEHPDLRKTISNFQSRYLASLSFSTALTPSPVESGSTGRPGQVSVKFEDALFALDERFDLAECAIEALHKLAFVGICEEFAMSLNAASRVMGWAPPAPEVIRLNRAPSDQAALGSLSSGEIDILASCTRVDQEVYDAAFRIFVDSCRAHDIVAPSM